MSRVPVVSRDYLQSDPGGLWRWDEEGRVLEWYDGSTLAFHDELAVIVRRLSGNGLPPFGCLVLALAAFKGLLNTPEPVVARMLGLPHLTASAGSDVVPETSTLLASGVQAVAVIRGLQELPAAHRLQVRAKARLLELLFEGSGMTEHRHPAHDGPGAGRRIARGRTGALDGLDSFPAYESAQLLARCVEPLTTERLGLLMETGMDSLVSAADVDLPPHQRARALLEQLRADPEHQGVARLAGRLIVALRLPTQLSHQDELALGGVADICNRGRIDRLLLSELAHDDLTLTTRIALGEALYLKREPPGREAAFAMALLLDSGIRMWGLPRVLATSAALALAANAIRAVEVKAWSTARDSIIPVDLMTRAGLTRHLGHLSTALHPAGSLHPFREACRALKAVRSVLITHRDCLDDPDFRSRLNGFQGALDYIAVVDRTGRFSLFSPPYLPRRSLCDSRIDVESVLEPPSRTGPLIKAELDPALPRFLRMNPAPLLLPFPGRLEFALAGEGGCMLAVLGDRRLVDIPVAGRGGRLLAQRLPSGGTLWADREAGVIRLVRAGSLQRPNRLVVVRQGHEPDVMDLCGGEVAAAAWRTGSVLLLARDQDVHAYSLLTGELLDRKLGCDRWHRGRFFASPSGFKLAHWDGQGIVLRPIPLPADIRRRGVVSLFEREGSEGPWVLTQDCQVMSLSHPGRIQVPVPISQLTHSRNILISRDGHRISIDIPNLAWTRMFELPRGEAGTSVAKPVTAALNPMPRIPGCSLNGHQDSIHITEEGELCLRNRRQQWRVLSVNGRTGILRWSDPRKPVVLSGPPLHFTPLKASPQGIGLSAVGFPSGARAVLDSRGLLHLQPSPVGRPEVSIALTDTVCAAWSSDGFVCGRPFFHPPESVENAERVAEHIERWIRSA